jgi:hypothetical protein
MSCSNGRTEDCTDATQTLIEELLRTSFVLSALGSLLEELSAQAFPGEDNAAVLIEMVVGSCRPAIEAAGERECRAATALIGAVRDRLLDDLRAAAQLAKPGGEPAADCK